MVLNTWSLPGVGRTAAAAALLAGTLLVWLSSGAPTGRTAAAATTRASAAIAAVSYEAEDAWMSAGLLAAHSTPGFSGTGYVTGFTRPHAELVLAVAAPADGRYGVALRYANGSGTAKVLNVYTNGIAAADAALPPTGDGNWSSVQLQLPLRAGLNTITFAYERGSAGAVSIDNMSVIGGSTLNGRGATEPYQEYEAEDAATNGTVIGPSRVWGTLAAEASGRRAVTLDRFGQYVEFTLRQAANGMELRYSIPDAKRGGGITASLSLYVDGRAQRPLTLTSKYAYLYGPNIYSKDPATPDPYHFFDEVHLMFGSMLPAGTKVRVQIDRGDTAPSYTIDLADFEQVPAPYAIPAGYLSAVAFGADSTGATDSTQALQQAVNTAERRHLGLYIPRGTYTVTGHILLNDVTVRGAGPWYTVLHGAGVGLYGDYPANPNQWYKDANADGSSQPSARVQVYDLMIAGETTDRQDAQQVNGFGGGMGGGSIIQNVWIEHTKVGMWFDGPFSDLLVVGCRLRDLTADGINLHDGIDNVTVEQTQVRNTGDDGMALWSDVDADALDVFRNDTVQIPTLANNIAIYSGRQNSVLNNLVSDTVTQGAGITVANRSFHTGGVLPLAGTIRVSGNTLERTGQVDFTYGVIGALWFKADFTIDAKIIVTDDEIDDSAQEAIQFQGNGSINNVTFDHIVVRNSPTFVFQVEADVLGGSVSNVVATHTGVAGIYNCGNTFAVRRGPGNSGWSSSRCADLPTLAAKTLQGLHRK